MSMGFDPDTITQDKLHEFRRAAEHAWSDETRPEDSRGHPQPSAGHCYVTSKWLQGKLGGHIGVKQGHYFWVSPDKAYIVDLTGDQDAYGPVKWAAQMQDEEDEPFDFESEQMRHRPGPIIYAPATNPLYQGFRVKEYPNSNTRAELFADRANAALEGKLTRQADAGGSGSDAYPGEGPQAEEEFNLRDFHDPVIDDLNLSMEEPVEHEYKFFFGNGEFKVSPLDDHETMAQEAQIPPDHTGPMAVGYVNVRGRDALWSVESNIGLRGLVKMMKDYSKRVGWKWGGLVDGSGQPIHNDFGAKKSYWYGWRDGDLKLSTQPFWGSYDEIEVVGRTASFNREPNPFALPGLEEWAKDFGYRFAHQHQLYWSPGSDGRGIVDADGSIHTWNGDPTHAQMEEQEGLIPTLRFTIDPQGEMRFHTFDAEDWGGALPDQVKPITDADPSLHPLQSKSWDFYGHRYAEYPGGTDMNDRVKNKEWPTTYDKGDPEADPGAPFDGEPQGSLRCPYCSESLPNFKAYVMHTQDHQDPQAVPIDDGHFPTIEDKDEPLPLRPRNVTPTAIPIMGSINNWKFAAPEPYVARLWHGSRRGSLGPIRPGFFATSHKPEAEGYAGMGRGFENDGRVHSVSVNFQNPLYSRWHLQPEAIAKAQREGHDGVVLHFPEDLSDPSNPRPERQWVYALDPSTVSIGETPTTSSWKFESDAIDPRVKCPHCESPETVRKDRVSNGVPFAYGFCRSCGRSFRWPSEGEVVPVSPEHPDPWMDSEPGTLTFPESWKFEAAGGKEGKDLLQAPIPFIYDIEKDNITVGHPGMRTPDVMPVGGEELITIPVTGLPPQGQEGQEVELGGEIYVWHNY